VVHASIGIVKFRKKLEKHIFECFGKFACALEDGV